jgi:hypothetical protein
MLPLGSVLSALSFLQGQLPHPSLPCFYGPLNCLL